MINYLIVASARLSIKLVSAVSVLYVVSLKFIFELCNWMIGGPLWIAGEFNG